MDVLWLPQNSRALHASRTSPEALQYLGDRVDGKPALPDGLHGQAVEATIADHDVDALCEEPLGVNEIGDFGDLQDPTDLHVANEPVFGFLDEILDVVLVSEEEEVTGDRGVDRAGFVLELVGLEELAENLQGLCVKLGDGDLSLVLRDAGR